MFAFKTVNVAAEISKPYLYKNAGRYKPPEQLVCEVRESEQVDIEGRQLLVPGHERVEIVQHFLLGARQDA